MIVEAKVASLKQVKPNEFVLRFVFGGLCTMFAGMIATHFGPRIGGLFLAFPAIFPAGASLIEKHETARKRQAGFSGEARTRSGWSRCGGKRSRLYRACRLRGGCLEGSTGTRLMCRHRFSDNLLVPAVGCTLVGEKKQAAAPKTATSFGALNADHGVSINCDTGLIGNRGSRSGRRGCYGSLCNLRLGHQLLELALHVRA